jgi:hypothetical protein
MVSVDLLINDQSLADEIRGAVASEGAQVSFVRGETGHLTGAEIEHVIQIVMEGLAYGIIKDVTLRLKDILLSYWRKRKAGFSVVVDGIAYKVTTESDIDDVLNAISEASARLNAPNPK